MIRRSRLLLACLLGWPCAVAAAPGVGTLADPIRIDAFPYVARGTTIDAPAHAIDVYSCAAADEAGGEVAYVFALPAAARVSAWVEGDAGQVDIDVHLLGDSTVAGTTAAACAARGNVIAEVQMSAGTHYVVVDTYQSDVHAGPYVLHVDAVGDAWNERIIADGVVWRSKRYVDYAGGPQVVNLLVVDRTRPGVAIEALRASNCQTVGAMGVAAQAVAGINGGYFNMGTGHCDPLSLLKHDGVLLAGNAAAVERGAFAVDAAGLPMTARIGYQSDWPEAVEAQGGGPLLVVGGAALQGPTPWDEEGISTGSFRAENPRTFAGFAAGKTSVTLGVVDGRRAATAHGMSLDDLATYAGPTALSLEEAVNLDGGGSSTLWIAGATPNGVVNYPSDAGSSEKMDHSGSRPVSGGFFVFAAPYNHPPRFQTTPPPQASVGMHYEYDADAIDIDVKENDEITFELVAGPAGMTVDPQNGVVRFLPPLAAPATVEVVLVARDSRAAAATQSYTLAVAGGVVVSPDGSVAGDAARWYPEGWDGAVVGDNESATTGGGCGIGSRPPAGLSLLVGAVLMVGWLGRRRR